jgi:hypothetical protein
MNKTKKAFKTKEMELHIIYDMLFDSMTGLVIRYKDPQMVASTMVALSLRLYRTVLSEPQFLEVLNVVVKNAKDVKPYDNENI